MDTSPSLPIPRLRLTRHSPQSRNDTLTPTAGPSRLSSETNLHDTHDEDEDTETTPRVPTAPFPITRDTEQAREVAEAFAGDTPAARLRAILAKVPNTPPTPQTLSSRAQVRPETPSEPDSDLDPPYSITATPSIARESLKQLFSHAMREPGSTPRKGRLRRNSFDTSEVDINPRLAREEQTQTARSKGKQRKSMSDEEADHMSNISRRDEESARTPATTFDALRERLAHFHTQRILTDMTMPPSDTSEDTATLLRELNKPNIASPQVSSSPMRSIAMSSQLHAPSVQSNLLEGDSEMQRALGGMDSYGSESRANGRPLSLPPAPPKHDPVRPLSWTSHSKSHSAHNLPLTLSRRGSVDFGNSSGNSNGNSISRAGSSSQSGADFKERVDEAGRDHLHERERRWNHPQPKSSAHLITGRASPVRTLTRRTSNVSLHSSDGLSSRASSVMSRSDYQDRAKELDLEHQKEREREWNKPNSKLSRSSSSLSLRQSERTRTHSQPTRPDSAQSFVSPARRTLSRHSSFNSLSSSSRASSPAGSISGRDHEPDTKPEIVHQRERNWNSPRPNWTQQTAARHPSRASSPMPSSPSPSTSRFGNKTTTPPKSPGLAAISRQRTDSTTSRESSHQSPARTQDPVRSTSPHPPANSTNISDEVTRPASPSSVSESQPHNERGLTSGFRSRFGWSFPRSHTPPPPSEVDTDSPEKLAVSHSRPSSRLGALASTSLIPVRSPSKKDKSSSSTLPQKDDSIPRRSHKRSLTELSKPVGALPPRIVIEQEPEATFKDIELVHPIFPSDDESPPLTSTPTGKPFRLPTKEEQSGFSASLELDSHIVVNGHEHTVMSDETTEYSPREKPDAPPPPPPTPPDESEPGFASALQTPPRSSQSSVSKLEFQTPSPPRDLPDLPEPPSFTDADTTTAHTPFNLGSTTNGNLTAMKTPKPPGAWMQTPEARPPANDLFDRPQSTPPNGGDPSSSSNPLVTPMSTWPRANSVPPLQTPAPPGAWMPTPATTASARRRSIMKVRFDIEPETTASESGEAPSKEAISFPAIEPRSSGHEQILSNGTSSLIEGTSPKGNLKLPQVVERPSTPPNTHVFNKASHRTPTVRVVDAFGRKTPVVEPPSPGQEQPPPEASYSLVDSFDYRQGPLPGVFQCTSDVRDVDTNRREAPANGKPADAQFIDRDTPEEKLESKPRWKSTKEPGRPLTPRSKSAVKIVDAMGREVEDVEDVEHTGVDSDFPMSHNEALARARQTIADMADDLSELDRSVDLLALDDNQVGALENASRAARNARHRLSKSLQLVKSAEQELRSRYKPLRESVARSRFLPTAIIEQRVPRAAWLFWAFVIVQLAFLLIMYRLSNIRARRLFLTTYYDPFYADLYLYADKPDSAAVLAMSHPSWTVWKIPETVRRAGWTGLVGEIWSNMTMAVSSWQRMPFRIWSAQYPGGNGQESASWPPT